MYLCHCEDVELPNSEIRLILKIPVNHFKARDAVLEILVVVNQPAAVLHLCKNEKWSAEEKGKKTVKNDITCIEDAFWIYGHIQH